MWMDEAERQLQDPYGARFRNKIKMEELLDEENKGEAHHKLWEKVSDGLIAEQEYSVGSEMGLRPGCQLQLELLHALDYDDRLFCDSFLFNTCTKCGMSIPSKLWWERQEGTFQDERRLQEKFPTWVFGKGTGKFSYKCVVEWRNRLEKRQKERL